MNIGEKIAHLRNASGISQEQLAHKLSVSRQSVSKWEMGDAIPQIDKVIMLCDLFCVSADDLIRDEVIIHHGFPGIDSGEAISGDTWKYFGTGCFLGEANTALTSTQAYKIGRFLGWYYQNPLSGCRMPIYRPKIVVGKDTRRSSYMIEYAIVAGITASGADAYMLHVTTTPSVSFVTRQDEFDCGVIITASHNLYYDNGIKIKNKYGEDVEDSVLHLAEQYLDGNTEALGIEASDLPLAKREKIGCIIDYVAGRNRYVGYLISVAMHSYKNMKIGLDCANGASWTIAKSVFDALGAQTYTIGTSPDGTNINLDCGSTHIETLVAFVREKGLDAGFAFDGDADRCIAVDEYGNVVDGDKIIYILAKRLQSKGNLEHNTVVSTVLSNYGLTRALAAQGIRLERTEVGDRYVYRRMIEGNYRLGGEPSGHIILKKYATTCDGILTAIMLLEEMKDRKSPLSKLAAPVGLLPQKTKTLHVTSKDAVVSDPVIREKLASVNSSIRSYGRALLRKSITEPVIRITLECETEAQCDANIAAIASAIKKRGYLLE